MEPLHNQKNNCYRQVIIYYSQGRGPEDLMVCLNFLGWFLFKIFDPIKGNLYQIIASTEAAAQRCSVKNVFLEISQNSQGNTCASFLINLLKKRLWHRCFPVNFAKFLRTPFLQNTFGRLFLQVHIHMLHCALK